MVYTLTLNPSLDYVMYPAAFPKKGGTNRSEREEIRAGIRCAAFVHGEEIRRPDLIPQCQQPFLYSSQLRPFCSRGQRKHAQAGSCQCAQKSSEIKTHILSFPPLTERMTVRIYSRSAAVFSFSVAVGYVFVACRSGFASYSFISCNENEAGAEKTPASFL